MCEYLKKMQAKQLQKFIRIRENGIYICVRVVDLEEIGINAGNWVDSAHDMYYWRALVNVALNLRVP